MLYSRQICRYSSRYTLFKTYVIIPPNIRSIYDKYVIIPPDMRSIQDKYVVIPLDIHSIRNKYVVIPLKYTLFTTNMSLFL